MGIRLVVEVMDYAPPDLTPAERLVLIVIAEAASDDTREAWPSLETIARRAGLKPGSVSQVFLRLAKRQPPMEVRVALMIGRDGRPVYAYEGRKTTYRIPDLRQRPDQERTSPAEARPQSGLSDAEDRPASGLWTPEGRPPSDRGPTTVGQRADQGRPLTLTEPSLNPQTNHVERPRASRGTRVPDDFAVTDAMRAWYREHAPDVDIAIETANFVDHWRAASGAKATKADWTAAWRTWMRNAQKWKTERTSNGRSNGRSNGNATTGANRHVDQLTPEQRAARNPFANATRASEVIPGRTR